MEYTEKIDDDKKIIFVKTQGRINTKVLGPLAGKTRSKAKELNYLLLFDFSKSINYISIVDAYNWPADHYDTIDKSLKFIPFAHIVNDESEGVFSFVETTWTKRGATGKVFKDEKLALEWLEQKRKSKKE